MKEIIISVTVAVSLVLIAMFFTGTLNTGSTTSEGKDVKVVEQGDGKNVFEEGGKQIIEITARGGYAPRNSIAKAGVPTIIRMKTSGTFDCSSALSIPSLAIRLNLPPSGVKDIEIPAQKAGSKLAATCSMGMYNFDIQFQ
ncbi:MAG TPA: hypothetical protein VJ579_05200 [Candidatus Paceibacterota bacterium]|nr:hypothetical protein [Candidatus Paceibacterota bacterium]